MIKGGSQNWTRSQTFGIFSHDIKSKSWRKNRVQNRFTLYAIESIACLFTSRPKANLCKKMMSDINMLGCMAVRFFTTINYCQFFQAHFRYKSYNSELILDFSRIISLIFPLANKLLFWGCPLLETNLVCWRNDDAFSPKTVRLSHLYMHSYLQFFILTVDCPHSDAIGIWKQRFHSKSLSVVFRPH